MLTDQRLLEVNGKNVINMEDKQIEDIFINFPEVITITIIPESIYYHLIKKYVKHIFSSHSNIKSLITISIHNFKSRN